MSDLTGTRTPAVDTPPGTERSQAGAHRRDPRRCGLSDAVLSGWCNAATGELFPGFDVGPGDAVLDVGCGDGLAVVFCAQRGGRVWFCDVDARKVASISHTLAASGLGAGAGLVADGARLPWRDGSMTRVIATEVLEHVADPRAVVSELARVAAPGAKVLISVPDAASERFQRPFAGPGYFEPPNHLRVLEPDALERLVSDCGFEVVGRGQWGFFWFVWMSFYWLTRQEGQPALPGATFDAIRPPYHPLLESWAETWSRFLEVRGAAAMQRAFNDLMPKSRVIVARRQ